VTKLATELESIGCTRDPNDFRDRIIESFKAMYVGWTDEDLLHKPTEGIKFCDEIRRKLRNRNLPEELILRTLTNARKAGVFQCGKRKVTEGV
jgi:hypothetical protein